MIRKKYLDIVVPPGGGTTNITTTDFIDVYYIVGNGAVLAANFSVAITGTPQTRDMCLFKYIPSVTPGGNTVTVLGTVIPSDLLSKKLDITAEYDGAAWQVVIVPSFDQSDIIDASRILAQAVTTAKIAPLNVTSAEIAAGAISADKLTSQGKAETIVVELSFAAADQGDYEIYMPFAGLLTRYNYYVTEDIAATDDASIQISTVTAGVVGGGTFLIPAGAGRGTTANSGLSAPNNFAFDSKIVVDASKVTPGGKILLTLVVERT